jgi:hypothetical protein
MAFFVGAVFGMSVTLAMRKKSTALKFVQPRFQCTGTKERQLLPVAAGRYALAVTSRKLFISSGLRVDGFIP